MTIFWLTLAMVFISGYYARIYSNTITVNGIMESRPHKFFAFNAALILIMVSGLRIPQRGAIGDTGIYTYTFINFIPDNVAEAMERFQLYNGDSGFNVFQSVIKEFISPNLYIDMCFDY